MSVWKHDNNPTYNLVRNSNTFTITAYIIPSDQEYRELSTILEINFKSPKKFDISPLGSTFKATFEWLFYFKIITRGRLPMAIGIDPAPRYIEKPWGLSMFMYGSRVSKWVNIHTEIEIKVVEGRSCLLATPV
jgi:hypothetical protein